MSASAGGHPSLRTPPGTAAGAHPWQRPTDAHTLLPSGSVAQPALQTAAKRKQKSHPRWSHCAEGSPFSSGKRIYKWPDLIKKQEPERP